MRASSQCAGLAGVRVAPATLQPVGASGERGGCAYGYAGPMVTPVGRVMMTLPSAQVANLWLFTVKKKICSIWGCMGCWQSTWPPHAGAAVRTGRCLAGPASTALASGRRRASSGLKNRLLLDVMRGVSPGIMGMALLRDDEFA